MFRACNSFMQSNKICACSKGPDTVQSLSHDESTPRNVNTSRLATLIDAITRRMRARIFTSLIHEMPIITHRAVQFFFRLNCCSLMRELECARIYFTLESGDSLSVDLMDAFGSRNCN